MHVELAVAAERPAVLFQPDLAVVAGGSQVGHDLAFGVATAPHEAGVGEARHLRPGDLGRVETADAGQAQDLRQAVAVAEDVRNPAHVARRAGERGDEAVAVHGAARQRLASRHVHVGLDLEAAHELPPAGGDLVLDLRDEGRRVLLDRPIHRGRAVREDHLRIGRKHAELRGERMHVLVARRDLRPQPHDVDVRVADERRLGLPGLGGQRGEQRPCRCAHRVHPAGHPGVTAVVDAPDEPAQQRGYVVERRPVAMARCVDGRVLVLDQQVAELPERVEVPLQVPGGGVADAQLGEVEAQPIRADRLRRLGSPDTGLPSGGVQVEDGRRVRQRAGRVAGIEARPRHAVDARGRLPLALPAQEAPAALSFRGRGNRHAKPPVRPVAVRGAEVLARRYGGIGEGEGLAAVEQLVRNGAAFYGERLAPGPDHAVDVGLDAGQAVRHELRKRVEASAHRSGTGFSGIPPLQTVTRDGRGEVAAVPIDQVDRAAQAVLEVALELEVAAGRYRWDGQIHVRLFVEGPGTQD